MRRAVRRLLLFASLLVLAWIVYRQWIGARVEDGSFLLFDFHGSWDEGPPDSELTRFFFPGKLTAVEALHLLDRASSDPRLSGLVVRVRSPEIGWARAEEFRESFLRFREAGKSVVSLLETEAPLANRDFFLASAGSPLYVSPGTTAPLLGLSLRYLFFGELFEKLGVHFYVARTGPYKTGPDFLTGRGMSKQHREMAESLLESVRTSFVSALARARKLPDGRVLEIFENAPSRPEDFVRLGLADGVRSLSEIRARDLAHAPLVDLETYHRSQSGILRRPRHAVAVVPVDGTITLDGPPAAGAAATELVRALEAALSDPDVRAILVRVHSPGGSALASDLVWRAIREAGEKKPVVASLSDVAASGGYYLACGADLVFASETSLTGSIGVFYVRPNLRDALEKAGVRVEVLSRDRYATIHDPFSPLDEAARRRIEEEIDDVYDLFLERVATSRRSSREEVERVAGGRVWTGRQAVDLGLVDAIGGFSDALAAAKERAGIPAREPVRLVFYPAARAPWERIREMARPSLSPARGVLSESLERLRELGRHLRPGPWALMPERILLE
ncbi:MAG: protease IV [Candidatus Binatia bacterium]|nr:MAG: protease IV [Candidatus Binatia bacterium]